MEIRLADDFLFLLPGDSPGVFCAHKSEASSDRYALFQKEDLSDV